jgi:hypothetical protein
VNVQRGVWAGLVGAPVAVELWAFATDRDDWMLSPHARWLLRCDTPAGRAATTLLVGGAAAWLAHHLITIPPPKET